MQEHRDYIIICARKQLNGLWPMPLACTFIDEYVFLNDWEKELKHSAILLGMSQEYPDETLKIYWSEKDSFLLQLSKTGLKFIKYDDYELCGHFLKYKPNAR